MTKPTEFEIPETVRQIAEQNVAQARTACEQFMGVARQAQDQAARSQGEMAATALEIQSAALGFAEQNIKEGFDFAARMARARDLGEYLEVQAEYANAQLRAFNRQAEDLGQMLAAATKRSGAGEG